MPDMSHDPLAFLGADIFHLVLSQLSVHELLTVESVCTPWRVFSRTNSPLWNALGRRLGVDMLEYAQVVREREDWDELERELREHQEETKALVRILTSVRHGGQADVKADMDINADTEIGTLHAHTRTQPRDTALDPAVPARHATIAHLELKANWAGRVVYETLVPTPAFKLRHVAVDPTEDTLYALTESAPDRMDKLLVLDRYTGKLLLTIPWIVRNATMSVGAGYVVIASAPGVDHEEEAEWGIEPGPVKELHVYRTAKAAERAAQVARRNGSKPPPAFKHDRGLPLEYVTTITEMSTCRAFRVKLDTRSGRPQALLAGVSEGNVLLCHLDNDLHLETIETVKVETIDACTCGGSTSRRNPRVYLQDINFDDESIYILTQYQCHIIDRDSSDKIIAFPDLLRDVTRQAALVYNVPINYPFIRRMLPRVKIQPPRAPPGLHLALTAQARDGIDAVQSSTYPDRFRQILEDSDDEDEGTGARSSAAELRSIIITQNDLVIRSEDGEVTIVRNHRHVFRQAAQLNPHERAGLVASHTAILKMNERIEDVQVWDSRLTVHSAEMTLFIFDLDQLPTLPLAPGGKIPFATAYVLEISCLQGMQARSSFALDARGIYLADWDKGYPDEHLAYEPLHLGHQLRGEWPDEIRPNWGCIKIWTARPESTLLTYDYPRIIADAMGSGIIHVANHSEGSPWDSTEDETDDEDEDEDASEDEDADMPPPTAPFVDDDYSQALAAVFGTSDQEEEPEEVEGVEDVAMGDEEEEAGDAEAALLGSGDENDNDHENGRDDIMDQDEDEGETPSHNEHDDHTPHADIQNVDDAENDDMHADDDLYQSLFNPNYPNPMPSTHTRSNDNDTHTT